jgi:hypothetical protein
VPDYTADSAIDKPQGAACAFLYLENREAFWHKMDYINGVIKARKNAAGINSEDL